MALPLPALCRYIDVRAAMGFAAIHMAASQGEGRPPCSCCMCKWRHSGIMSMESRLVFSNPLGYSQDTGRPLWRCFSMAPASQSGKRRISPAVC